MSKNPFRKSDPKAPEPVPEAPVVAPVRKPVYPPHPQECPVGVCSKGMNHAGPHD